MNSNDWEFKGLEGGANLLLNYIGLNSNYINKLLRLRKRPGLATTSTSTPIDSSISYLEDVIIPLLDGTDYIPLYEKIKLDKTILLELKEKVERSGLRLKNRIERDEIDVNIEEGILIENLIGEEGTLAIEIKPKWGFLPSSIHLTQESARIKSNYCRFCTHRYFKLQSKSSTSTTQSIDQHEDNYCPLDLYSGDKTRMTKALNALWNSWIESEGENNNFRIFLNGERIIPNEIGIDRLNKFLVDNLHFPSTTLEAITSLTTQQLIQLWLLPSLHSSTVLSQLSNLQSSLDPIDIETLFPLILSSPSQETLLLPPNVEEWKEWLKDWKCRDSLTVVLPQSTFELRQLILAYLVSATFKDCSIFFREKFSNSSKNNNGSNGIEIKLIDLDIKPIQKLIGYYELDEKIWKGFSELLEERRKVGKEDLRKCRI